MLVKIMNVNFVHNASIIIIKFVFKLINILSSNNVTWEAIPPIYNSVGKEFIVFCFVSKFFVNFIYMAS